MIPFRSTTFLRVLAVGAVFASVWLLHARRIAPLRLRMQESASHLEELRAHLASAPETFRTIKHTEREAGDARAALNGMIEEGTRGAAMTAFPESIRRHFARFNVSVPVMRLNTSQAFPGLPGYQRAYWSLTLPVADTDRNAAAALLAVSQLENENRLVKVLDFVLKPDVEDPGQRIVGINIVSLLPEQ